MSNTRDFKHFELDVNVLVEEMLFDVANSVISYIESSDIIPVKTHNLKDSTGLGVYQNSVLKQFYISPKAKVANKGIWGSNIIQMALDAGRDRYNDGNYIVLFSAMPYAEEVDDGYFNRGFFTDALTTQFILEFEEMLRKHSSK